MARNTNPDFLNGVPEMLVLRQLKQKPCYGYELGERLRQETGEAFNFHDGSLYPVLHRLEKQGYVTSRREIVNSRVRRVYEVTDAGTKHLAHSVSTWIRIQNAIRTIVKDEPYENDLATE